MRSWCVASIAAVGLALSTEASAQVSTSPIPSAVTCGAQKAAYGLSGTTSRWTIAGPSGSVTETGTLRAAPRFECVDGAVLTVEVTSTAGHSMFTAYFPDGSDIAYGRQQIDRRGGRYVLPIQAKARIGSAWRAAFDYHCRLDMPADPISPAMRGDCLF